MQNESMRLLSSQIQNLKYDRDLLIQESKTFLSVLKWPTLNKKIKTIDAKIKQLRNELHQITYIAQVNNSPANNNHLQKLKRFLTNHLTSDELTNFCFYSFPSIYNQFMPNTNRDFYIRILLERATINDIYNSLQTHFPERIHFLDLT